VDDPDGTRVYEQTMLDIHTKYEHLTSSISALRLQPTDQLLDTLLSSSHICLQLSIREGFEVKVSEALHKGIPVIATRCGGIPLQVQHGKNGFLVDAGDSMTVASHLLTLWTNGDMYKDVSEFAKHSVSDEVGTVGNALSWFYLADVWSRKEGRGLVPREQWVNDLARDAADIPYGEWENRLPRNYS
jgi:glycosyltransferase involved in cell wall biosynthesis